MREYIDFSDAEVLTHKLYGGANGSKIGIQYRGEEWLLKFSSPAKLNLEISYSNNCISDSEIEKRLYKFPKSAIKYNGFRINYVEFLSNTDNIDCLNALVKINSHINLVEIFKIVDETPVINDVRNTFYKVMIQKRKQNIIERACRCRCQPKPAQFGSLQLFAKRYILGVNLCEMLAKSSKYSDAKLKGPAPF